MRWTQILLWWNMLHEKIWSRALFSTEKVSVLQTYNSVHKKYANSENPRRITSILFDITVEHSSIVSQLYKKYWLNNGSRTLISSQKKNSCFANIQFWYIKKYANTENQEDYKVYYLSLLTIVRCIVSQLYKKYWLNKGSRTLISSQ